MSYPVLPSNRMIVNGVDITEKFKMVLLDGYTLTPPSPKTYVVDIPCGNGSLDLTESLLGDTAYENRKDKFEFSVIYPEDYELVKNQIINMLHGRAFDYKLTMDPDYTYHGRFTVESYERKAYANGLVGTITISTDSNPFKHKELQIYKIKAIGGCNYSFESGREPVCPVFESEVPIKVIYNGILVKLNAGKWNITDLIFKQGLNSIYINSLDVHNLTWGDLKKDNVTWGQFKEKPLFEWYRSNGDGTIVITRWEDMRGRWSSVSNMTWEEIQFLYKGSYNTSINDIKDVTVSYDWGDL